MPVTILTVLLMAADRGGRLYLCGWNGSPRHTKQPLKAGDSPRAEVALPNPNVRRAVYQRHTLTLVLENGVIKVVDSVECITRFPNRLLRFLVTMRQDYSAYSILGFGFASEVQGHH